MIMNLIFEYLTYIHKHTDEKVPKKREGNTRF